MTSSWKDAAACRGMGTAAFFSRRTSTAGKAAVDVCRKCPVRQECLDTALEAESECSLRIGIWGGLGPYERAEMEALRRKAS